MQPSVFLFQTYIIMTSMDGISQSGEASAGASSRETRTSPGAPEISAVEKAKNQRQYEHNKTQIELALKFFNTPDPDESLKLWMKKPSPEEPSMAEVFGDTWPSWREAHPKPIIDGVALQDFLEKSGLAEKARKLSEQVKKAA